MRHKNEFDHLLPAPDVLYNVAKLLMARRKALESAPVSESLGESFSEHLNHIAIGYLKANGGR